MSQNNQVVLFRASTQSTPMDAETIVSRLEMCAGNIETFVSRYSDAEKSLDGGELFIGAIELWLSQLKDKKFKARWDAAIKQNAVLRLKLLQNRALKRLESLTQTDEGWLVLAKENQGFKMILANILAGETHAAKQSKTVEEPHDDDDDAELDEVIRNA